MTVGVYTEQSDPAVQALSNGSTITLPTNLGIGVIVSSTGNVTGIILTVGANDGDPLYISNSTAFTVTMAAAGTSHVQNGTACVIRASAGASFRWEATLNSAAGIWVCTGLG